MVSEVPTWSNQVQKLDTTRPGREYFWYKRFRSIRDGIVGNKSGESHKDMDMMFSDDLKIADIKPIFLHGVWLDLPGQRRNPSMFV